MRSAWWWGTAEWEAYQIEYYKGRERPEEYKTSPLVCDHDFTDWEAQGFTLTTHQTCVIDLTAPIETLWQDVRKSSHSLIHRANEQYEIKRDASIMSFRLTHHAAFGQVRSEQTFVEQQKWLESGHGMSVSATFAASEGTHGTVAAAYWIVSQDCAYYASGPSIEPNVQHAVIWRSLELLKAQGVCLVEMGQIDGETEKERNVGKFKSGWGGTTMPFTVATRRAV